jgi:hypothetical protein
MSADQTDVRLNERSSRVISRNNRERKKNRGEHVAPASTAVNWRNYVWMIFGVMKKISSCVLVLVLLRLNALPRTGISPSSGTCCTV